MVELGVQKSFKDLNMEITMRKNYSLTSPEWPDVA